MRRQLAFSLVGMLAAVAIGIALVVVFVVGPPRWGSERVPERADGVGETVVGRAMARGYDAQCIHQLAQVRQAVQMAADPIEGSHPQSLQELSLGAEIFRCPVGGAAFRYDPATGMVACPHPGHERH